MQRTRDWRRHQFLKRRQRALRRAAARHNGEHFEVVGGVVYSGPYRPWRSKTPREVVYLWHPEKKREKSELALWFEQLGIRAEWQEETKLCPWSDRWVMVRRRHVIRELAYREQPIWRVVRRHSMRRCRCEWCVTPYKRHARRSEEYKKALHIEGL